MADLRELPFRVSLSADFHALHVRHMHLHALPLRTGTTYGRNK
ncbi:hypothetical protein [Streptomyces sp. ISL-99]|nr:hypothetical protein [Streptomyces sp. ISL-99]